MGQAKQRGTFEQRQAEGIAKRKQQELKSELRLKQLRAKPNSNMATLLAASLMAATTLKEI